MASTLKKFIVVAMARTGSNALISALLQHKNCYADFELFHGTHIPGPLGKHFTPKERDADPYAFLEVAQNDSHRRKADTQHYGFKIFFGQNDTLLQQLIVNPEWPVVLMRRENVLDQFLSLQIAWATDVWNSNEGKDTAKTTLVENDFLRFKDEVDVLYWACEQKLKAAGQPFFKFTYADVAAGQYGPLCEFLELPKPHDIAPKVSKQNPARTADKLENPDAVYAMLQREGLVHYWVD